MQIEDRSCRSASIGQSCDPGETTVGWVGLLMWLDTEPAAEQTDAADEAGASYGASPLIGVLCGRSGVVARARPRMFPRGRRLAVSLAVAMAIAAPTRGGVSAVRPAPESLSICGLTAQSSDS